VDKLAKKEHVREANHRYISFLLLRFGWSHDLCVWWSGRREEVSCAAEEEAGQGGGV
jgi:hypothetical protein